MTNALPFPCEPSSSRSVRSECQPHKRGILIATIAGSSLAFIVGSIINVALPAMQDEFAAGATGAQWIVNAYLLPLGALVLMGGAIGDHVGRKRVFLAGLVIFTAACLVCALAWSFPVLILGRALEGVGAAMIAPTSLAIIADGFSGAERGRAVGTWAAVGAAAGAVAPLAGGIIVDVAGWRWTFVAVMPIAVLAWAVARHSVRESVAAVEDRAPLDWLGAGLISAGLLALIWSLVALPERGATGSVLMAAAAGVMLVAVFLLVEHRKGNAAMTPLTLFGSRSFSGLSLLTFFLYMALGGLLVLLPYVLIRELDYGATQAGAAILPFPLILGLLSRTVGGSLAGLIGTRRILALGSVAVACGFFLFTRVPAGDVSYWRHILPGLVVLALGMAASVAPLTSAVLASAGDRYTGVASGINNAISRIGGLVATALLGVVLIGSADKLADGFSAAAWAGVALAGASALSAWLLVDPKAVGSAD
ncbi:MAG: MFS transporter [Burkholderiaceae bacterium]